MAKQTVAEFDGLRVLSLAWIRRNWQGVVLIVGFEMPMVIRHNIGVVSEKRLLRMCR